MHRGQRDEHDTTTASVEDLHADRQNAATEVAYVWDMRSDVMIWESDAAAAAVLGLAVTEPPTTGDGFRALIADEHVRRHEGETSASAHRDFGAGVGYAFEYELKPLGLRTARTVTVQDNGRWWAGPDGRPVRARGRLRCVQIAETVDEALDLRQPADYDDLTGVLNRQRLSDALRAAIERVDRDCESAAVLMISVNNLQQINDKLGFEIGDEVLRLVAQRLRCVVRGGDTLARYSSNKFCLILRNCRPSEVRPAAERLFSSVSTQPLQSKGALLSATLSVGACLLPEHAHTVDQCYGRLLRALEAAHVTPSRRFAIYQPDDARELKRIAYARAAEQIGRALSEDRLTLALQAVVRSGHRQPSFFECLLRISDDTNSVLSAATFVPIAEELGLAGLIDRNTLQQAVGLLRRRNDLTLSLNISALTCADSGWLCDLEDACRATPGLAGRLIIEITETAAQHNPDEAVHFADRVRELGVRIAIDDFGAGYTSFDCLKRLPADILKIDGSFARNLPNSPADQILLKTVIGLGQDFNMETVVEWVSDEPTAKFAEKLGATYLQGFHCSVPQPAEHVLKNLDGSLPENAEDVKAGRNSVAMSQKVVAQHS